MFTFFVLQVIKHNGDAEDHLINSIGIGIALYTCLLLSGAMTGGCLNPVVGLVQFMYQKIYLKQVFGSDRFSFDESTNSKLYSVYILAPLLGGGVAGLV